MDHTCPVCESAFTPIGRRKKYCSPECGAQAGRNKPGTCCSQPGCERPIRARELCGSHYNQILRPDRHRKQKTCASCDIDYVTTRASGRYCSEACWLYDAFGPPKCDVFLGNCTRCAEPFALPKALNGYCSPACMDADGRDADAARREQARLVSLARQRTVECAACGLEFGTWQPLTICCSFRCARRMARLRRKAGEAGSYGEYRWSDFMRIAAKFSYCCAYCGKPAPLEPDHVVPISKAGPNTAANLLPSCRSCNCDKRDVLLSDWNADRARRGLDPRVTTWTAGDVRYAHLTSVLASV